MSFSQCACCILPGPPGTVSSDNKSFQAGLFSAVACALGLEMERGRIQRRERGGRGRVWLESGIREREREREREGGGGDKE